MHCTCKLSDSVYWTGGCDRRMALFENLFPIPHGITYNSYLIMDEHTALIDTVDASISRQFFGERSPYVKRTPAGLSGNKPYGTGSLRQH